MASNDQNVFDKIKANLAIANREKGNSSALTVTSTAKQKADAAAAAKTKADTLKAMAAFVAKQKADTAKNKVKTGTTAPAGAPQGISKTFADFGDLGNDIAYSMAAPMPWVQPTVNFGETVSNFLTSRPQAAPGQGAGDIQARNQRAAANAAFPNTAGTQNAMTPNAGLAREVGASNFTQTFANPATGTTGTTGSPARTTGGAVTPATIAKAMAQTVGGQRAAEMAAAKAAGLEYTPGQAAGTAAKTAQEMAAADALAESNAGIESAYNPVMEFLNAQKKQTEARYAQNSANLKNIFGALTGLSAVDTKRVNDQFTSSLTKQKADLEARTAEQRTAQEAGMAQLARTGAERGNGPALGGSPTATATEEAIGQSNAIQQNWEGLMGAQQANAITDITNRGVGYGQQEIAATNQMTQNLQDALMGIQGQEAGIQSQIAQAKLARDQAMASGEADAIAAANKMLGELKIQELKNQGAMDVATLKANASLAAKRLGGGSASKEKVPASEAIKARADKMGPTVFQQIQTSAGDAYNQAFALLNPRVNPNDPNSAFVDPKSVKSPTAAAVKSAWQAAHRGKATSVAPLANDYIDSAYK
jgi:hypothetical protein